MTTFGDNIYSGNLAATSAASSVSPVRMSKTHRITPGGAAFSAAGVFPQGTMNLDAKLYILLNASATVSDKITVSAGGVDLITITQFGSAAGVLRNTTTGLGVLTVTASACAVVAGAAAGELTYSINMPANTAATGADYQLELMFTRADTNFG